MIENKFTESGFFENVVVLGENEKFASALIVPDFSFIKTWCEKHEIQYTKNEEMLNTTAVKDRLTNEVQKINSFFGDTEKIKRFKFISDEWSTANGILTPTLKVKRSVILNRYKDLISRMYQGGD